MAQTNQQGVETLVTKLKEAFKNEGIEIATYQKPPSYVSCFSLEATDGIILVHNPISNVDVSIEELNLNGTNDLSVHDMTGNPLEHPFDDVSILNESSYIASEFTFMPPGVADPLSRSICSFYNLFAPDSCLPLWVVCDGNEVKGNIKTRLQYAHKIEGKIIVGFATDTGPLEEPDVKTMIATHSSQVKKNCSTSIKIGCQYKISDGKKGRCSFEMRWKDQVFHPPVASSSLNISAAIEFITGSGIHPLNFIWEQLQLINEYSKRLESECGRFCDALVTSEVIMRYLEASEVPPSDRLLDILREPIILRNSRICTPCQRLIDFVEEVSSPNYNELDTLGKLWYLFLECPTTKELSECLDRLSGELQEKRLGSHLNQIRSATSIGLDIAGISPLKLLVEFGLVKMRKEMLTILSEVQISTMVPDLPRFSTLRLPDWLREVNSTMRWLAQSYSLLELMVKLQEVLPGANNEQLSGIAMNHMRSMASDAPNDVDWFLNNPLQRLQSPLRSELADFIVRERSPNNWLMTIESKDTAICTVESRFVCSSSRIFVQQETHNEDLTYLPMNNTEAAALESCDSAMLWSSELLLMHHSRRQN